MYLNHCPYTNAPSTVAHGYLTSMPYHSHVYGVLLSQTHLSEPYVNAQRVFLPWENLISYISEAVTKKRNYRSICFAEKPSVKIVFYIFQCLVVFKKISQWKIIFNQWKTLIKRGLIFYCLFSYKNLQKTSSLPHCS